MSIDLSNDYNEAKRRINAYLTVKQLQADELLLKKQASGDNFAETASKNIKQLNSIGDLKQRAQQQVKTQFEELIDLFISTVQTNPASDTGTINFLIQQVLGAANNTKSRISEIVVNEVIKSAGCTEEQTFNPLDKIYISVKEIDIKNVLKNDPNNEVYQFLYEKNDIINGVAPFSMNKELYNRLQQDGVPFSTEYGRAYIGASGNEIFDIKYVTQYTKNGTTFYGEYYEITLKNRIKGNNLADLIRDYFGSIEILNFDNVITEIMNQLTNVIDLSVNLTTSEKEDQKRLEKIIQRILGLCFDSTREIDVQGTAKIPELDKLDQSFFELTSLDLRNIENEVNDFKEGVIEFTDCGTVKFPIQTDKIVDGLSEITFISDDKGGQKIDKVIEVIESLPENQAWKLNLPDGLNVSLAIKTDFLKIIPRAVLLAVLSPKVILGLMMLLKSLGVVFTRTVDDVTSFIQEFGKMIISMLSKISSIFIEELFKMLKKNIKRLVETLITQIIKESKDTRVKIINSVLFVLIQLASAAIDYRQCKSVIDEILNLLNLSSSVLNVSIPSFALAASSFLGGYSPTRAMSNVTENLQQLGVPTGALPDGSPNIALAAIFQQIRGSYEEQITNGKVEIFVPPLAVGSFVGGTTLPGRAQGKFF